MGSIGPQPPKVVPIDITKYPKLDSKQAGHLRHYYNLVAQKDGYWNHFDTADGHEEFDDARRYQLATMCYAAGIAHYHRLPALRGPFKTLMRQMIYKMLLREVWSYWYVASQGGKVTDPDLKELRKPWADPVVKENIMYSGHLLLMTSLYAMLFDDDEFEKEGGITFQWNPLFWGLGSEEFRYDNRALQKVILQQMEENEWVGVCCEPNAVFVVCNQFPLIAMRYNDIRDGTNYVEDEILPKYKAALTKKGMFGEDGLYASYFAVKQKKSVAARHGAHTAWANAFMNSWNSDFVHASYEKQNLGFLTQLDGKTRLHPTQVAKAFRQLVLEEGHDPNDEETLRLARVNSTAFVPKIPFETLNWLSFTMQLSELGKEKELADVLQQADEYLQPTWENGGLYYPRNEQLVDKNWNLTAIEPHSGNSGIGYARLNVPNGQKIMWEKPWTREVLANRPWIEGLTHADDIDFLRGQWDPEQEAMIVTVKKWRGDITLSTLVVKNCSPGAWAVYVSGKLQRTAHLVANDDIEVEVSVSEDELDVVVQRLA